MFARHHRRYTMLYIRGWSASRLDCTLAILVQSFEILHRGSDTAVCCAEFHDHWVREKLIMCKRDFTRFWADILCNAAMCANRSYHYMWHHLPCTLDAGNYNEITYFQSKSNTHETKMCHMISSHATPTVCLEQKSANLPRDISDAVIILITIALDIICYVAYHSSATFKLPV